MSTVKSGKVEIHYDVYRAEEQGSRPWIVFAHGAGGNAASWWQQVPFFFDDFDIVTFDHRAFGRSRCADEDFDPALFADDLARVIDAVGIETTALCCQSMGGRTGLDYAVSHRDRVTALVMSHTVGGLSSDAIQAARDAIERPEPSKPFGSWAVAMDLPEKNRTLAHLYNCIGAANVDFQRMGLGGLRRKAEPMAEEALEGFNVPTLFITAHKDVVVPPRVVELGATMVPGAELVNLGDAGHSSYFEAADEFNEVVADFLRRHAF